MKNISVRKLSKNPDIRYSSLLSCLEPVNFFSNKKANIGTLPYLEVVNWYKKLGKVKNLDDMCSLFTFVYQIEPWEFWGENVVNFFAAKNFIEKDFKNRQEAEAKLLQGSSVDPLMWKAAGGDSLRNFSTTSPLDDLCQRYGGYPFDLGKQPYNQIMWLITQSTRKTIVNANYQKLISGK